MTEKVKLTREQADAIERYRKEHGATFLMNAHSIRSWSRSMKPCNKLSNDEMARALYIGYEVEPEFVIGDVVVLDDRKVVEIVQHGWDHNNLVVGWIANKKMYKEQINLNRITRHATEQEEWWAKHGRDVWELRIHDLLVDKSGEIWRVTKVMEELHLDFDSVPFEAIKNDFKVACFAEDRKDIEQ